MRGTQKSTLPKSKNNLRRESRLIVAFVLALSFFTFNLYSFASPLFEVSDELWHYPFVQHLSTGGTLPIQHKGQTDDIAPWRQEGSQPPFYYAVAALITAPFDSSNWREIRRINPHSDMGVPTRDGNANAILHTSGESFPWSKAALAVRVARLVSIIFSTFTVLFAYLVACELFLSPHIELRIATMIFTTFVPMFAFISGSVNNDNAAIMFSTIGLWYAFRVLRNTRFEYKSAFIAGGIVGLAALSKSSSLGLLGVFSLSAFFVALKLFQHHELSRSIVFSQLVKWCLILVGTTFLISGWWFIRNVMLYGDLLGWNAFLDVVGRRSPTANLLQLWSEREGFVWAFWGVFGTLNIIMPEWVYGLLNAIFLLAVFSFILRLIKPKLVFRPILNQSLHFNDKLLIFISYPTPQIVVSLFFVIITFLGLIRWTSLTPASQGRLMFPCLAIIAAGVSFGLYQWNRWFLRVGCLIIMLIGLVAPFMIIAPVYKRPVTGWSQVLPLPLNANFGEIGKSGMIELNAASATTPNLAPGNEVKLELNWRIISPLSKNYSLFVHLVDQNDVIIAQRDMYPGQGNIALSELTGNDTWSDYYVVRISSLVPPVKNVHWRVGLYDYVSGERLKLPDGKEWVAFGQSTIQHNHTDQTLFHYSNGVALDRYTVPQTKLKSGTTYSVSLNFSNNNAIMRQNQGNVNVSLQLIDDQDRKIAQKDVPLLLQTKYQNIELTLASNSPNGVYRLLMVVYEPNPEKGFPKLGAYDQRGQYMGDQIELTRLRVE
jgi:hypothetical protein